MPVVEQKNGTKVYFTIAPIEPVDRAHAAAAAYMEYVTDGHYDAAFIDYVKADGFDEDVRSWMTIEEDSWAHDREEHEPVEWQFADVEPESVIPIIQAATKGKTAKQILEYGEEKLRKSEGWVKRDGGFWYEPTAMA